MNNWESLTISTEAQMIALQVAISGAGVSGLVLLAARLLRRRSAPLRYGVLLAGVFGLLAVPALVLVGLNVPLVPAGEEIVKLSAEMLPAFLDRPPVEAPPPEVEDAPSAVGDTVGAALICVWGGFALLGLMRLLVGVWKQRRAILGQPWTAAWWTDERRACLAEKVGLRRFPVVHCSPNAPMPMVVGLLRPKILLPECPPSAWGQPQWEAVLLHEAAHIARRDPWAALAQCLAVILFWWCPLVHLMARRLNDLREAICDDYALEGPCDRLAYAELLVESAERLVNLRALPVPLGLIDSAPGGLESRITRLLEKEKEPMKKLSLAGKLLGASFLVAACLSITAATAFTQTPPAKKVQIKLVLDGKEIDLDAGNLAALLQALPPKPAAAPAPGEVGKDPFKVRGLIQEKPKADDAPPTTDIAVVWNFLGDEIHAAQSTGAAPSATPGAQPKPDPRIEEIVKQAEAIKPGSGADIRRALQAAPKTTRVYGITTAPQISIHAPAAPGTGKHVIVLTIDAATGKVLQIGGPETKIPVPMPVPNGLPGVTDKGLLEQLQKLLQANEAAQAGQAMAAEVDARLKVSKGLKALGATKAVPPPAPVAAPPVAMPVPPKMVAPPMAGVAPKAVPPPVPDVEALARQLERITRELQELRQRLDANKQ